MGTFSKIFGSGDKKLQERADELLVMLSKSLQSASAKLHVASEEWVDGSFDVVYDIRNKIIEIEREADHIKEDLVENILSKHAYLPQHTQERHILISSMDEIIDACEDAVRVISLGQGMKPPKEIEKIAKKCWICTDLLQDAIKYLFDDFSKSVEKTRELDRVREEARDVQFELLRKLFREDEYKPNEIVMYKTISERILQVAIRAEMAGDFIRELAVKYS